ncbi:MULTISPECIES: DUF2855 family protein [unclassified Undibacterium]|uniref:DUF2855 family protein n=1 Tax=unclassified Undibacterium TaxID=2630295 RepID=UPI002AC9659D|nr:MULTISPECIES: DUF2855 family protein [unclassified Undibacterium]MEB0138162.1 DUF2855 family protein [Undibacterium sp. CCC2.1]MEB0171083.1 DUF2855 family protein [Undibacterium sp. CCC1.1]MEB0175128.1 DUF2855 family protein [Undibacterium sp. CCC3.4]MEB0214288.1 DUF2855 family protein [Undibacterium sp. 5I2]WPX41868.1 DUF2855 family protein [Undibacterium sp. CCC3.4]
MNHQSCEFIVDRAQLHVSKVIPLTIPTAATLVSGQVLLKIDHFAFTANNVTYAAFGTAMKYWNFFPTVSGWGNIPVWGFADVVLSTVDGIAVGQRYYGYYPMATHLCVTPGRFHAGGFSDTAPHRQEMHGLYNQYLLTDADPAYTAASEAEQMLLRPLFITSFMIDDFLDQQQYFGATDILISSASSKTAYGLAFLLAQRQSVRLIGLTSAANRAFVESLGVYHEVHCYEDLAALDAGHAVAYVDMAGNASLRAALHEKYQDQMRYSCAVGGTHWDELGGAQHLPGARPVLFFAPAQIKLRLADWGPAGLQARVADAWQRFMQPVLHADQPWLRVQHGRGAAAVVSLVERMLAGQVSADEGHVLSLN